jgi:hydrogenase nickel incorporation protein HypA/HybF
MHELSIGQALLEQVEAVAVREAANAVVRVVIVVGALSGVDPDALRAVFPLVAEGTVATGAELIIEQVAASVKCCECGEISKADECFRACPACGSQSVELVAGRELNIKAVEVEVK